MTEFYVVQRRPPIPGKIQFFFKEGTVLYKAGHRIYAAVDCGAHVWTDDGGGKHWQSQPHNVEVCLGHHQTISDEDLVPIKLPCVTPEKVERYLSGEGSLW